MKQVSRLTQDIIGIVVGLLFAIAVWGAVIIGAVYIVKWVWS